MRFLMLMLLLLGGAPAQAQVVALPVPDVDVDAAPRVFLLAARQSLAAGRDGEAMEALERAESRALVRDVRPSQADQPSAQGLVKAISAARSALGEGDRLGTLGLIDVALQLTGE